MASLTPALFDALADVIGLSGQGREAARLALVNDQTQNAAAEQLGINRSTVKRAVDKILTAHERLAPFLSR